MCTFLLLGRHVELPFRLPCVGLNIKSSGGWRWLSRGCRFIWSTTSRPKWMRWTHIWNWWEHWVHMIHQQWYTQSITPTSINMIRGHTLNDHVLLSNNGMSSCIKSYSRNKTTWSIYLIEVVAVSRAALQSKVALRLKMCRIVSATSHMVPNFTKKLSAHWTAMSNIVM